jgi:cytochrome c oxidase subunit III
MRTTAQYGHSLTGMRTGVVGMWVALSGILMLFTALTSAYIVRAGLSDDWRPLVMPRMLWLSTALILASSASLEAARRCLKQGREQAYRYWLLLTVVLGISFLGSQLLAWRQMVTQGIYIATNPHSSFFYTLTGTHGLHLLFGILALDYLLLRAWRPRKLNLNEAVRKRQTAIDVVGIYWHFMGGLWVYLFLLLFVWR